MPTKNRVDRAAAWYVSTQFDGSTNTTTKVDTTDIADQNVYSARGPNNKFWHTLILNGQNCSTTLDAISMSVPKLTAGWTRSEFYISPSQNGWSTVTGQIGGALLVQKASNFQLCSGATKAEARTLAEISFAKQYLAKARSFNGGEFVGEIMETARQIEKPGTALRAAVDDLRDRLIKANQIGSKQSKRIAKLERRLANATLKYQRRALNRQLKLARKDPFTLPQAVIKKFGLGAMNFHARAVAGTWLEWNFGIRPVIKAMNDIAKASMRLANGTRAFDIYRVKAVGVAYKDVSYTLEPTYLPLQQSSNSFPVSRIEKAEVTIRGAWRSDTPTGEMKPLPVLGVSARDLIPTLWDLTPLSVFVDYFTNIGDVLDAWSMRLINFAWINETTRSSVHFKLGDVISAPNFDVFQYGASGGHAELKFGQVSRKPKAGVWDSGFMVKLPTADEHRKWLNLAAFGTLRTGNKFVGLFSHTKQGSIYSTVVSNHRGTK